MGRKLFATVSLALLFCRSALSQSFSPPQNSPVGDQPYFLVAGDFNEDLIIDLAIANFTDSDISIRIGNGNGTFTTQVDVPVIGSPKYLAVADFNQDGFDDLAATGGDLVSIRLGNGDGTFNQTGDINAASSESALAVGDFNNDFVQDLAVSNIGSDNVTLLLGNGNGGFVPTGNFAVGTDPESLEVGDFDNDGNADVVVANYQDILGDRVSILLGNGAGGLGAANTFTVGDGPRSVAVADLNRDFIDDFVVALFWEHKVSVHLGNGNGTFQAGVKHSTGTLPRQVIVVDTNADGLLDLVTANESSDTASVLTGTGNGGFNAKVDFAAGDGPKSLAPKDLNGDGRPDLCVANRFADSISVLTNQTSLSSLVFQAAQNTSVAGVHPSVIAGNFNSAVAEAHIDAVMVNSAASVNNVIFLQGNGNGTFDNPITSSAGSGPTSVAAGDFGFAPTKDGILDIAVTNQTAQTLSVLKGNGDGTFANLPSSPYNIQAPCKAAAVGLINNDNILDIAVANGPGTFGNTVTILLGNASGGFFITPVYHAVGTDPTSVLLADFNRDARPDFATSNFGSGNVSVNFGVGDGTFGSSTSFLTGSGPAAIASGDFNRDGSPDLVTANNSSHNVSVLLNNGDGTFGAPQHFVANVKPDSVVVTDCNGDGRADLFVANKDHNSVSALLGTGNGSFLITSTFSMGNKPDSVAAGDFNGDGRVEPIMAPSKKSATHVKVRYRMSRYSLCERGIGILDLRGAAACHRCGRARDGNFPCRGSFWY